MLLKTQDLPAYKYSIRDIMLALAIFIVYFILGSSHLHLSSILQHVSPIWPASGVATGCLLLFGLRFSPAIFLGALATNMTIETPIESLILIPIGNTLEAIVGSQILKWILKRQSFKSYSEIIGVGTAAMVASIFSATFGVGSLFAVSKVIEANFSYTWYTWWSGDMMGILLITPLFTEFYQNENRKIDIGGKKLFLSLIILCIMLIITYLVFVRDLNLAFSWAILPSLLLSGILLGSLTVRSMLVVIAGFLVILTAMGYAPFEYGDLNLNITYLHSLLAGYALAALFVRPFRTSYNVGAKFFLGSLMGWMTLILAIYIINNLEYDYVTNDFHKNVNAATENLTRATFQYEILLKSGSALFDINPRITNQDWKKFVESMDMENTFGAVNGLGFIGVASRNDTENYIKDLIKKGSPEFKVRIIDPDYSARFEDHFIISFIEPFSINSQALGLDIGSEKSRRHAAWLSKRLKEPMATAPIQLVQDPERRSAFLILYPIGEGKDFRGWVYAPVVSSIFFSKALQPFTDHLNIRISTDGKTVHEMGKNNYKKILNRNYQHVHNITLFGVPHVLEFYPTIQFFILHSGLSAPLALMMMIVYLLITAFLLEQIIFGQRADALVKARTTELEQSKMQLVQSSKMASLGEMASGLAHEIYNPLTIILGKIEVLSLMIREKNLMDPHMTEEITKIKNTTNRIGKIVAGLKNFSRAATGDPFDLSSLREIIEDTLDLCSEKLKAKSIDLRVDQVPNIFINCRPSEISQVLLNLIHNAADAVEGLPQKWIHLEFELRPAGEIRVIVTDSGKGIPEEVAQRVMEPFFTTKDVGKGTGLGLSIAKGIIEAHGGELIYDREYPHTRFIIRLSYEETL